MKKALGILSVLVLITVMMISCNAEQKLDDTVGVSFNVSSSRELYVENQPFEPVNSDKLTWYYHGVKKTDQQFTTGQSASMDKNDKRYWTEISTGDKLSAEPVTFSQGQWFFEIKAMKGNTQMYYGETNGNVLLTKGNNTISISVSPFVSGVKGTLKIESVYINPEDSNSPNVAPNRLLINGALKNFTVDEGGESISYTYELEPGTYTVEVKRVGYDTGIVLASASRTVVVYSGLTTTIKGCVEEDTTIGTFDPQPVKPEGSKPVTVPEGLRNAVVEFVNVTPTMEAGKSTTVTIPSAVLDSASGDVTLNIAVKDSESVADSSFVVNEGNGVAASISLTMNDNAGPITDFRSNEVTVVTYIETGLSGVTVKYKGEGNAPSGVVYVPATGKLTFKTTHFSEFYVEALNQAKIGTVEYCLLQKAFDASKYGDTVVLLSNVDPVQTLVVSKNITLDMNGKTISNTNDIWNDATRDWSLISVRGGNLTVTGEGSLRGKENDCFALDVMDGGNLVIENGTFVGNMDAIYVNKGSLSIKGGEYSIQQKSNYNDSRYLLNCLDENYKNGTATIVVSGGKFHGFNPANCKAEGDKTNFISDWYRSTYNESDDIYEVSAKKQVVVSTDDELSAALTSTENEGEPIIVKLNSGSFTLPNGSWKNKNIKFVGSDEGTELDILPSNATAQHGATLAFENMTIQAQSEGNFGGLAHTKKVTYKDCKILGKITLYAETEEFINCTFENKNDYAIWTWGGNVVNLTGCTFNSGGKAVLLYGGSGSTKTPTTVLTVTDCVFNDDDTLATDKAAIETGNDYGATYTLNVNNATVNGFAVNPEGILTETTLWANKNSMDEDHLSVTVDGTPVYGN